MANNTITNKIKSFLKNNISILKLNLSFFSVGIFFTFLSYPTFNNIRSYIGAIFLNLWFFSAPFLDRNRKDQIMMELCKLVTFSIVSGIILIYFINTFTKSSYWAFDIFVSLISIPVAYYWIGCLLSIINGFKLIISKVYTYIFNSSDDDSPLKIFVKNISAFFLTISGFLATLVAIVTSVKSIVDIINK